MMNKKGALVLRNILFMMIIFGSIMALASIFVFDMAGSNGGYENTQMEEGYRNLGASDVGNKLMANVTTTVASMSNSTSLASGSFELITGAIKGISSILRTMLLAPVLIKETADSLLLSAGVPGTISFIVGNIIMMTIYGIVIFVIISSLLKGGKV